LKKVNLVGHSMGGAVAIDFTLEHKEYVKSLIVIGSGLGGYPYSQRFRNAISKIVLLARKGDLDKAKRSWLNLEFFNSARAHLQLDKKLKEMISDTSGYRWYGKNKHQKIAPLAYERLEEIKAPTLVIVGEKDIDDVLKIADLLEERIQNCVKKVIADAGHMTNMENPKEVNKLISHFLINIENE